jgi:hypothetical protein
VQPGKTKKKTKGNPAKFVTQEGLEGNFDCLNMTWKKVEEK